MSLERLEELSEAPHSFTASLIEAGLLVATGSAGIFGHTSTYEAVIAGLGSLVRAVGDGEAVTTLNFPPVMTKADFEQTGYLESFPNLIGAVRSFSGSEAEHSRLLKTVYSGGDWSDQLHPVDLVLCSAACHPIYRTCTGRLPGGGRRFEVSAYCFRREPSADPARLQAFRMHEHVYVGEASTALAYRDKWVGAAEEILVSLGLNIEPQVATDPFFGRAFRHSRRPSAARSTGRWSSSRRCPPSLRRLPLPRPTGTTTISEIASGSRPPMERSLIRRAWGSASTALRSRSSQRTVPTRRPGPRPPEPDSDCGRRADLQPATPGADHRSLPERHRWDRGAPLALATTSAWLAPKGNVRSGRRGSRTTE